MSLGGKVAKKIADEIAPQIGKLVKKYVSENLTSDVDVKLLIRAEVKAYLELMRHSIEDLERSNHLLVDRLTDLLGDYDGLRADIVKLRVRVEKVEEALDQRKLGPLSPVG